VELPKPENIKNQRMKIGVTQSEWCNLQPSATQTLCKSLIYNYAMGVGWSLRFYQHPPSLIPTFPIRISQDTDLPKIPVSPSLNAVLTKVSLLRCLFHVLRRSKKITEHQQMH
jgi:hypothetical protein